MSTFAEKLDGAAAAAACGLLTSGGSALIGAGAWGIGAGGSGFGAIGLGAAALMAANMAGCPGGWNPGGDPQGGRPQPPNFCNEGASQFILRNYANEVLTGESPLVSSIVRWDYLGDPGCNGVLDNRLASYQVVYLDETSPAPKGWASKLGTCDGITYTTTQTFVGSDECIVPGPVYPPAFDVPPYVYTSPDDGCQLTVNFEGFAANPGGNTNPVWKIEPTDGVKSGDDVIGGCNFSPVFYYGDPDGGPPVVGPWEPEWDDPDAEPFPWGEKLDEIAEGIEGAATKKALDEKFDTPLPETEYRLNSVCEVDAAGNPVQNQVIVQVPSVAPFEALMARLDALVPLLQGQKDFKQPTCPNVKLAGEFRTIGFISEDYSPNGRDYLRKRLRYRSQSGLGLDALLDHWRDFQFDAGPVIVKHRGASWGTVTVWASSSGEGKRVIRHAAGEAGIDADQVGRWEISGSSSTRLGMSGKMKVNTKGGYYWITARDGSDNRPLVGTT